MATRLFDKKQSFLRGLASIGNLSGTIVRSDLDFLDETDAEAIASDWQAVGDDLWAAIGNYDK